MEALVVLVLIVVANGSPVLLARLLDTRADRPVDGGRIAFDGRPWLGPSKTLRGVLAGIALPTLLAPVFGLALGLGLVIGLAAMLGDLLSSFCKRRLGLASSARALGLDQLPESLLPAAAVAGPLELSALEVVGIAAAFLALELLLSRLFYRLRLRKRPY
jgi:CDP-2,3-bis-(O-geranylgeranyl)-sn-glycerol synthase